ncbi:MAG TPA: helix-turn-helix domain-containing protein [Actinophytocola sp.]|jgi:transcriptional regulator with XRE-family HTH domain|nr:helix-turn-helix domain-containing protein [Actinophytocola sp.]
MTRAREVKLEAILNSLIERGGYRRNRQAILEAVGITAAALSQYTRGRTRPSFQKLVALADFFGVSLDYLVYGEIGGTPVNDSALAKYVEHALSDVQSRASRHSALLARIGRVLTDRIDAVAGELVDSRTAGLEGLIEQDEVIRVERYCRQADIVATDLSPNIIDVADGDTVAGQFFQVVTANLFNGCRYRFLLAGVNAERVARFRQMLLDAVGGDRLNENCAFRRTVLPVMDGAGLYQLDTTALAIEEPALFNQFSKYLLDSTWLGYVNRPNDDSKADMLMSPGYTQRARVAFDTLWRGAVV